MVALAIVAIILLLLSVDFLVESVGWRVATRQARSTTRPAHLPEWLSAPIPIGFLVDSGHVWIHRQTDALVRVGADGFPTALLGKPEEVRLLAQPGAIARGKPLALLTRQGRSLTLRSPVSGTLIACNADLNADDTTADPFGRGWFASILPTQGAPEESLHKADQARGFLASEWERVRAFVADHVSEPALVGATMADGGSLRPGFLPQLPVSVCLDLEQAFLAIGPDEAQTDTAVREESGR